jgi:preprotein translocase subunit SecG
LIQTILFIIFFLSCLVLIAAVLLQPGKSDAGALFTSSVSSTAFGPRGTASILSRITIGAAVTFMLCAMLLAMPALNGNTSILQSTGTDTTATPSPAPDANSNAAAANTNAAVPAANTIAPANSAAGEGVNANK